MEKNADADQMAASVQPMPFAWRFVRPFADRAMRSSAAACSTPKTARRASSVGVAKVRELEAGAQGAHLVDGHWPRPRRGGPIPSATRKRQPGLRDRWWSETMRPGREVRLKGS
jgi:hypothetical protein